MRSNTNNRPLIGLSDNYEGARHNLRVEYVQAIEAAGGIPVIIPYTANQTTIEATLQRLDGLLMTGGDDIAAERFGAEPSPLTVAPFPARDDFDFALIKGAVAIGLPVLAICRGMQCVNVAFGGTLYQDLAMEWEPAMISHSRECVGSHWVTVEGGTRTAELLPALRVFTNTHHHQAVKDVPAALRVSGRADDGVIEAIEGVDCDIVAVQFHPERLIDSSADALGLFKLWIEKVSKSSEE